MKSTDEMQPDHSQHLAQKLSETTEMTQERVTVLLTEYELAQQHAWKWDNATWQTAAIFLSASLAGFIVVVQIPDSSHFKFLIVCIIGLSAILILLGWLTMIQYWERYKQVAYFRLREIEQELGLWKNRYFEHLLIINRLKGPVNRLKGPGLSIISEDDRARLRRLEQAFPKPSSISVPSIITVMVIGLIIGWVGLIILAFAFTFLL